LGLNGTLVEAKICTFNVPSAYYLSSTGVPFRPDDGVNGKFSTNGDETDYGVRGKWVANLEHKGWLLIAMVTFLRQI
jgi:hypothetical protein